MLSCFRTIVHHQTGSFRPALRATTTAFFSTSRARKDKPSEAFGPLLHLLEEESNKKEDNENENEAKNFITAIKGQQPGFASNKEFIRIFRRNKPLHPTEFSRERRVHGRPRFPKPWDLGPPNNAARRSDVFHQMEIDPVDECMNSRLLLNYMTFMGRIKKTRRNKVDHAKSEESCKGHQEGKDDGYHTDT